MKGLGDARSEEKAQQLVAEVRKLLRTDPAFSREQAAKLARAGFRRHTEWAGSVKGRKDVLIAQAIFNRLKDTAKKTCPAARLFKWKMAIVDDATPD